MRHVFTAAHLKFVILAWAAATVFFTAVLMMSDLGGDKSFGFALYATGVHFALWVLALPLLSRFTHKFPLGRGKKVWNGAVLLGVVAAFGSVVMLSQWAIVYSTFFPYHSSSFWSFLGNGLSRFLPSDVLIGMVLVVALEGWRVWLDFQAERTRATELERKLAVSRLEALRMQLHPHFLFNTLHAITGLIVEQPATARRMVIALGDLLRISLKDTGSSTRSLAAELEFADLYLGIEKLRLGDRLVLDYDIEPEATCAQVPELLLQPLFENAVRHGAARILKSCEIRIRACRVGDRLQLSLHNDGPVRPKSSEPPPFGVGLTNTKDRLSLYYGDEFKFQYTDRPQGGVQIDISIPYKRAENEKLDRDQEPYATADAGTRLDH